MPSWLAGALAGIVVGLPASVISFLVYRQTRASQRDTKVLETGKLVVSEKAVNLDVLVASVDRLEKDLVAVRGELDEEKSARGNAERRASDAEGRAAAAERRASAAEDKVGRLEQRVAELEAQGAR